MLSLARWRVRPQSPTLYPALIRELTRLILWWASESGGCCSKKVLIQMAMYMCTLANRNITVHLDLDMLAVNPLDELFGVI